MVIFTFSFSFLFFFKFYSFIYGREKKGRKTLPRIFLCKDYSIVKIVIMIIEGKKNFDKSMTKPSVNRSV